MNRLYTPTQKQNVLNLRKKGWTYIRISNKTGISYQTVGLWIRTALTTNKPKKIGRPFKVTKKR